MTGTGEQGGGQMTKKPPSVRKHSIIAASLFVFDAFVFNQGVISGIVLFGSLVYLAVSVVLLLFKKGGDDVKVKIVIAAIYVVAAFLVLQMNSFNNKIALERAKVIIAACEKYKEKHGAYPEKLPDLVPEFLQEVPSAKIGVSSSFRYSAREGKHDLMYVHFPPFGRPIYHFETKKWGYLD